MKQLKWSKKDQDVVINIVKEAKEILNMQGWIVYNKFVDGTPEPEHMPNGKQFLTSALNTVTQEYEKITIEWYPALLADVKNKDEVSIRETVFHELTHGLTAEMYNIALDRFTTEVECREAIERLTQRVTRIICTEISTKTKK